jgi:hypothetical protein
VITKPEKYITAALRPDGFWYARAVGFTAQPVTASGTKLSVVMQNLEQKTGVKFG